MCCKRSLSLIGSLKDQFFITISALNSKGQKRSLYNNIHLIISGDNILLHFIVANIRKYLGM